MSKNIKKTAGLFSFIIGIITLIVMIPCGILNIIYGTKLLFSKNKSQN